MAEDKAREEQKRQHILIKVAVEDQPVYKHKDQLPAHMKAYRCLLTSWYIEPVWVTKQDEHFQLVAYRSAASQFYVDFLPILIKVERKKTFLKFFQL